MAHKEAKEADGDLHARDLPGEAVLAEGPAPDEPQVKNGEVGRLENLTARAVLALFLLDAQEAQLAQEADHGGDDGVGLLLEVGLPARDRGLE